MFAADGRPVREEGALSSRIRVHVGHVNFALVGLRQDGHAALTSLAHADQFAVKSRKDAPSWYHALVQTQSPDDSVLPRDLCRRDKSQHAQQACSLEKSR